MKGSWSNMVRVAVAATAATTMAAACSGQPASTTPGDVQLTAVKQ